MANGRKWTPQEKAIAKAGFNKGLTQVEIAEQLPGRTATAVRHVLASMGCIWQGDDLQARREISAARASAAQAAQKLHQDAKVRHRYARIDETGNAIPRPDQERMAAVLSDIAFRQAWRDAALRNGWRQWPVAA